MRHEWDTHPNAQVDGVDDSVAPRRAESAPSSSPPTVGDSPAWRDVLRQVARVASTNTTVLVTGESGTGKEVVANLVHQHSRRARGPLVAIDCAALPEHLLESQLFGHEKGAFTGAVATRIGRIEQAAGGTLFLDEVAEMSPRVQAKFLRVLEEREFQRVGGTRTLRADVRVIAATHHDLLGRVARNLFRADLYYRLDVFGIHIPPLRARREDILVMADSFVEMLGKELRHGAYSLSRDAREWLIEYSWPGNVRQLRNTIERAILLCDGGRITRENLTSGHVAVAPAAGNAMLERAAGFRPAGANPGSIDRSTVEKVLADALGNKLRAARLLGLTRAQFYALLERYGLN